MHSATKTPSMRVLSDVKMMTPKDTPFIGECIIRVHHKNEMPYGGIIPEGMAVDLENDYTKAATFMVDLYEEGTAAYGAEVFGRIFMLTNNMDEKGWTENDRTVDLPSEIGFTTMLDAVKGSRSTSVGDVYEVAYESFDLDGTLVESVSEFFIVNGCGWMEVARSWI